MLIALLYLAAGTLVARATSAVLDLRSDANVFLIALWPLVVAMAVVAAVAWCLDLAIDT